MPKFRKMITGANWKIYKKTCSEVREFVRKLKKNIKNFQTGLAGIPPEFLPGMALIYEPVWAIGQKSAASLKIIAESHLMVRQLLSDLYSPDISMSTRILYGGSVNLEVGAEIIKIPDVDGLAITRGALDADNFSKFILMTEAEAKKRSDQI